MEPSKFFNPEDIISQKREWSVRQHTRASSADSSNSTGAQRIFERFCIIGLPLDFDYRSEQKGIQVDEQGLGDAHRRGPENESISGPPYPSCVLFTYPSSPPLSRELGASISDFCHPHGIIPHAPHQDSLNSSLKEIVLDKPHWNRSDYSFVFQMQTSDDGGSQDDGPLYGICCYSKEIIWQPSCLIGSQSSLDDDPEKKPKLMAPVCYCILSRYPFFDLHFQILHTVLSLEKLDQIGDLLDRVSLDEVSVPAASRWGFGEKRNDFESSAELNSQDRESSECSFYETPLVSPSELDNEFEENVPLTLEQHKIGMGRVDQESPTSDTETPNAPLLSPDTPFFTPAQKSTSKFMHSTLRRDNSMERRKKYGTEGKSTSHRSRLGRMDPKISDYSEAWPGNDQMEVGTLEMRIRQVQQLLHQSMATIDEQLLQRDKNSEMQTWELASSSPQSDKPLVYLLNRNHGEAARTYNNQRENKDGESAGIVSSCIMAILNQYYTVRVPNPGERLELEINLECIVSKGDSKSEIGNLQEKERNSGMMLRFAYTRPAIHDVICDLGLRSELFFSAHTKSGSSVMEAAEALGAWTVTCLCRSLSLENILTFLTAVLLESRIAVFCPHIGLLTGIVLSLIPLLIPFSWHSLLLPVLPARSPVHLDLLDAPVPYVVGIQHKTAEVRSRCGDIVSVNVYKNQISNAGAPLPSLPQVSALADALIGPYTELARLSRTPMIDAKPVHIVTKDQVEVAKWFTITLQRYLKGLMVDLKGYTITDVSAGVASVQRTSVLLKEPFVDSFSPRDRAFMRQFVETQMFSVYCDAVL